MQQQVMGGGVVGGQVGIGGGNRQQQKRMPRMHQQSTNTGGGRDMRNMSSNDLAAHHQRLLQMAAQRNQQKAVEQQQHQRPPVQYTVTEPTGCIRAKFWTPEVENCYRFQSGGYRDEHDYARQKGPPEMYPNGWVKKIQNTTNGYFQYFGDQRECVDKYVPKVKVYSY
jgi:hypothetical protein